MIAIIESCLLAICAGVAAVGYGSGVARLLRIYPNLGDRGIVGLLVFGFLGCVLHFVVALSIPIQIVVLAGGIITTGVLRRDIAGDTALSFVGAAGLCLFVLLHRQGIATYDHGLYYLQTFKWNREFSVTLGLANLHGRLAYNSILFLIAPLTDSIEIGWIPNLLVVTFVMLSLWSRLRRIDPTDRPGNTQYWFTALFLLMLVLGWVDGLGIWRADSVAAVLIPYWVALALGFSRSEDKRSVFALLVISAVLAATIKLSAAPLLVLTMALGWFHRKEGLISDIRVWGFSAAVLAAWMLHGFLLSGCAVYPVRPTCFAVPWAASLEQVDNEKLVIQAWARRPWDSDFARVMQDWSWFPQWFAFASQNRLMQLMAAGLVSGAAAVALSGASVKKQANGDLAFVAVGLAFCLVFWFWSAPDLRFGRGFILATSLFGFSIAGAAWLHQKRFYSFMPQVLILLMILFGLFNLVRLKVESFVFVAPDTAAYQLRTMQATQLWVPRVGDQCWAHELPCTPYVNWTALAAIRWPAVWQYRHDPQLEPPANWTPMPGLISKAH